MPIDDRPDLLAFRERLIQRLHHMRSHPGMHGTDQAVDVACRVLLTDLLFIDDREVEWGDIASRVLERYGKKGPPGPFEAVFGNGHYVDETMSVHAEIAVELGYLDGPADILAPSVVEKLRALDGHDLRRSEFVSSFGPPFLEVGTNVLVYGTDDGLVFADFVRLDRHTYVPNEGGAVDLDRDPLLRDVRLPGSDLLDCLILSRLGKELRWGTGWWIDREDQTTDLPAGIAEQLRGIASRDPSQLHEPKRSSPKWATDLR